MIFYKLNAFLILLILISWSFKAENVSHSYDSFNSTKKYVIIDTDAGVDDALGLMLAFDYHKRGLIDILAITCTYGNGLVDQVVKNVLLTQNITGVEDVKVYRGSEAPLLVKNARHDTHFGDDALGNATHLYPDFETKIGREHAVLAIIRLVKQYPKQITMITLGPMTNLAMAIQLEPSLTKNLAQIISLGGLFNGLGNMLPNTEYNFDLDPEAVDIVLKKSECPLNLGTWDVALNYKIPMGTYDEIKKFGTERSQFIGNIYDLTIKLTNMSDGIILCDILCVIAYVEPELVTDTQEYPVAMELSGRFSRGQLVVGRSEVMTPFESSRNISFIEKIDLQKSIELIKQMARN